MRKLIFIVLLVGAGLSGCLQEEPFKPDFTGFEPVIQDDGWTLSTPENEGMDRELLNKAYKLVYSNNRYLMAGSLLVFRNGRLVAEAYPNDPADIHRIHNLQSCTKSFTSLLTGSAIQHGFINSVDEKLYGVFPEAFDEDEGKRDITLRHALMMQTGLDFDNDVHTLELYRFKGNSVEYVLSQEKKYDAGLVMHYNDGAPHLVSEFVERKTGKTLESFAADKLFGPLNIRDWKWESAQDGTTFGAFSLFLKPRDFGKVGQLLLQKGIWEGKSLIDSTYLAEATSVRASANFNGEAYGFYFWILPAWNSYAAVGHGGQFLLVAPEKNLVVVYTAWPYTSEVFFDRRNELMELILHSCK